MLSLVLVQVPLLEAAAWAIGAQRTCVEAVRLSDCDDPWKAAEAWRYGAAGVLAGAQHGGADLDGLMQPARDAASALARFFRGPTEEAFVQAARRAYQLLRALHDLGGAKGARAKGEWPRRALELRPEAGLGVPFPVAVLLLPRELGSATLQLKGGSPMPLLGLAITGSRRPSTAAVLAALRMGVRHLEVSPSAAGVVGKAIAAAAVPRESLFLAVPWELPLATDLMRFDELLRELGVPFVDLLQLPRAEDATKVWQLLQQLKASGRTRALGVRGWRPQEVAKLPLAGQDVEYAQCAFTPYRPGPSKATWTTFGQNSVALAASGLFSDWPHVLRPVEDPHVNAVASRVGRSSHQVLLRWALQLGLAVVFRSTRREHIAENLAVFDFHLTTTDMQLLSSLATLAEPSPPGDGFAHIYEPQRKLKLEEEL